MLFCYQFFAAFIDEAKRLTATTFAIVGNAQTLWGAIEKSTISLSQYRKKSKFVSAPNFFSNFGKTNNIFAVCK